jgi:hypothetical protein
MAEPTAMLRDLIRSLPVRSASGLPIYVAASPAAPFSTLLGMTAMRWPLMPEDVSLRLIGRAFRRRGCGRSRVGSFGENQPRISIPRMTKFE